MMTKTQYLLCKLAEEASEVAQIALKTQQFGLDESREGKYPSNRERCHEELNDLLAVVGMLNTESDFGFSPSFTAGQKKQSKVNKYLAYSVELGQVEPL